MRKGGGGEYIPKTRDCCLLKAGGYSRCAAGGRGGGREGVGGGGRIYDENRGLGVGEGGGVQEGGGGGGGGYRFAPSEGAGGRNGGRARVLVCALADSVGRWKRRPSKGTTGKV